jgi:septal ring factor EnvC (AmiA/AmiB activator)
VTEQDLAAIRQALSEYDSGVGGDTEVLAAYTLAEAVPRLLAEIERLNRECPACVDEARLMRAEVESQHRAHAEELERHLALNRSQQATFESCNRARREAEAEVKRLEAVTDELRKDRDAYHMTCKELRAELEATRTKADTKAGSGLCMRCKGPKERSDWWGCNACVQRDRQEGLCRRD